jgi:hypothetical protein
MGSSNSNIFNDEKASLEGLRDLIFIPVGFNSSKLVDPWHPSLIKTLNGK